jgi:hypothetical protein
VLANTCRDVAQQGEKKGRWKELTEQANSPDFSFFLNFSRTFQKALVGINFFYFSLFFYILLRTRIKKDATTKIGTYN